MAVKRRSFARARRAAGYTQESLAEHLGVDRTTVARWESGEHSPQPWLRPKVARAFGLSLSSCGELLDGAGTREQVGEVSVSLVSAEGAAVPLAGSEQGPAADLEGPGTELEQAYAETKAPQPTTGLPQLPWDTNRLA